MLADVLYMVDRDPVIPFVNKQAYANFLNYADSSTKSEFSWHTTYVLQLHNT